MRRALATAAASISARGVSASAKQPVNGFSTIACTPAASAAQAIASWVAGGAHTCTTSTCASNSSRLAAAANPCRAANASRRPAFGEYTAAGRTPKPAHPRSPAT